MAQRKLQAEIDKTLKQVAIGVETFESTFEKLQHATNATQKDKVETDLKTQIKKLQRIRDQIKAWISSSEIKDKGALVDHRKLIETQMERFKALEKEMKMKAFSKEGLIAQSRLDPAEKAKREIIDWIGNTNDELGRQIELTEAEAETINTGKKKKGGNDRLEELETLNERRQWHIHRLEVVQRMLENGQLQTDQVEAIQEDVKYFVESNMEEDFEEDEGIYDELNLVDDEDYVADGHGDETSNLDSASVADTVDTAPLPPQPKTPAKDEEKPKRATPASRSLSMSQAGPTMEEPPSPISAKKQPVRKATADKVATPDKPKAPETKESPVVPTATVGTPSTKTLPPIRYAAAAAAAVASQIPAVPTVPAPIPAEEKKDEPEAPAVSSVPPPPSTESPVKEQSNGHSTAPLPPPGLSKSPAPLQPTSALTSPTSSTAPPLPSFGTAGPPPPGVSAPPGYPAPAPPRVTSPVSTQTAEASQTGSLSAQPSASGSRITSPLPVGSNQGGVMGGLMHSFDMAKESSERRTSDINELNTALDTSYLNAPQLQDSEPPKYYHPRTPIKTPSYYPQTRLPILEDRRVFQRMDIDQLFFIFYYMTGSYEQWLAAQELKRQSWRFHKQYLTWFQRAHNPQAVTSDYEQGGYFYFDWENSWCQRKKSDFRFEYRWLSDD